MDFITILGLFLGIGGIFLGNFIEGGHTSSLIQGAAALIVFTGTFGSVLVSHRKEDVILGLQALRKLFRKEKPLEGQRVLLILSEMARMARKEGVLYIQDKFPADTPQFLRELFEYAVDGIAPIQIRKVFETKSLNEEEKQMMASKIWTDAGGFAPTIGILGAVLGLIHVMGNLTDTSKLGIGIAVAFVATIYGVGSANLIFIPLGNKIKNQIKRETMIRHMMIDGVVALSQGENPRLIEDRLQSYLDKPVELKKYHEPRTPEVQA